MENKKFQQRKVQETDCEEIINVNDEYYAQNPINNNYKIDEHKDEEISNVNIQYVFGNTNTNIKQTTECKDFNDRISTKDILIRIIKSFAIILIISVFAFLLRSLLANISPYKIGDIVKLGSWPAGTKAEAIEWIIIEKKHNAAILLSKNIIDLQAYNKRKEKITWETCTLRKWLNNDFYNKAFNAEEQQSIIEVNLKNSDNNMKITQDYIDNWRRWKRYDKNKDDMKIGKSYSTM